MILVNREPASHWYLSDGSAFHETPRADGNGLRAVTLRDARKVTALPSVTNILGVLAKPGLESWKQEQAILAALTLPRNDGETLDDFPRRVVSDMGEQVRHAADLGSAVHRAIEVYLQTGETPGIHVRDSTHPRADLWRANPGRHAPPVGPSAPVLVAHGLHPFWFCHRLVLSRLGSLNWRILTR